MEAGDGFWDGFEAGPLLMRPVEGFRTLNEYYPLAREDCECGMLWQRVDLRICIQAENPSAKLILPGAEYSRWFPCGTVE
jgi:hypothetical protein